MNLPVFQWEMPPLSITPEVSDLLAKDQPVAIGVSGGKDSDAVAMAVIAHLDRIGHRGPRVLIHSDLGGIEWQDSLGQCEQLAKFLKLELIVVRRKAGGLLERWETRWANNVRRYALLECVKLILPWSTPSMRFCTSELKTDVICRALVQRFPNSTIISVTGIRRQESSSRAKAPVADVQKKLASKAHGTLGIDWHAILDWTLEDVFACHRQQGFPLHPAYTVYGSSRVSCVDCIFSTEQDLQASARCESNHTATRRIIDLEIRSTFAFQGSRWLGETVPHLLNEATLHKLTIAKQRAVEREAAESGIPEHLLYTKGWPTCIPSKGEADLLASVRSRVGKAVGIDVSFTDACSIVARYQELIAKKNTKKQAA